MSGATAFASTCDSGLRQSPIDITTTTRQQLPDLSFDYRTVPLKLADDGHTVRVRFAPGNQLHIGSQRYTLQQFHFHTPGGDRIAGENFLMAAHLLHKSSSGQLLALVVLFRVGAENPLLESLLPLIPARADGDHTLPGKTVDARALLPATGDAHLLADGKFITADIRNCRVVIIDPKDSKVITQWGAPGKCRHNPPHELAHANGATPLANGDILVTEITDAWISRITREGKVLWSVKAPNMHYPSDAFPTVDGKQIIVADFWKPGRVVIFDPVTRKVSWEYFVKDGDNALDHSSIARELPDTGDILVVDDLNDRVMVIDRKTKEITWQYGEKGKKGHTPGLLNYPDGFDIDVFRDWKTARRK